MTLNEYLHKPQKVVETESATILWDFSTYTRRTIQANKPDIPIKDHKEKTCKLIDFTFPMDTNISAKEFEKLSKYKDLQIEEERMRQLKTSIVSIVVGALGLVKKGTGKPLEKIPGKQNLVEIQKTVLTSTAHILRKKPYQYKLQQKRLAQNNQKKKKKRKNRSM